MQNAYTGQTAPLSPLDFAAPDIAAQQRQLQRQQQLAELLRAQALQPTGGTEMVGGWAIPNSPVKPLEKLAQALMARHVQGQADEQETALAQSRSQALAQALGGLGGGSVDPQQYMTALALDPSGTLAKRMFPEKKFTPVNIDTGGGVVSKVFDPTTGQYTDAGTLEKTATPDAKLSSDTSYDIADMRDKTDRRGQDMSRETSLYSTNVGAETSRRGQDMTAKTALDSLNFQSEKASPENQARVAAAKAQAEAKAAASQALPEVEASGARAFKLVDELLKHPGLDKTVGSISGTLMQYKPGSDQADFKARLDEIKGGSFLQAINSLRGTGQITEVEGAKATAAINRMNTSQSKAEFVKAAEEFKQVIDSGVKRGQAKAGAPVTGVPASPVDALLEKYK